ncbi:MAG: Trm112 family protein [Conexivisphaerales archaeon]
MKYRLLDVLACPIDKAFPLELHVLDEQRGENVKREKVACELYCSYKKTMLQNPGEDWVKYCQECLGIDVREAVLLCSRCGRWYPVMDSIPRMLPDELRSKKDDEFFLQKYKDKLDKRVIDKGVIGRA